MPNPYVYGKDFIVKLKGPPPESNKENSGKAGRWTSEEHIMFLRGLELHGKGWKKIAKLIKTRTVVQIRTHAQKYFQKLAKAKRNGHGEIFFEAGRFGKKCFITGKRRDFPYGSYLATDAYVALSHLVEPLVVKEIGPAHECIEKAVYQFLCPRVIDLESRALDDCQPPIVFSKDMGHEESDCPVEAMPVMKEVTAEMYDRCTVPGWFRRGGDLDELLAAASSLDWLADNGGDKLIDISTVKAEMRQAQQRNLPSLSAFAENSRSDIKPVVSGDLRDVIVVPKMEAPEQEPRQTAFPVPPEGASLRHDTESHFSSLTKPAPDRLVDMSIVKQEIISDEDLYESQQSSSLCDKLPGHLPLAPFEPDSLKAESVGDVLTSNDLSVSFRDAEEEAYEGIEF